MTTTDTVNPTELKKLYAASRSAKAAFDHFAQRQNNSSYTTLDRLQAALKGSGHDVSRRDLIDLFKSLADIGCGKFVIGRRGKPSRFEWSVGLTDVGRAAAGEQVKVEAITQASEVQSNDANDSADMVEHRYRLRAGLELTLLLPLNLTASEATRIGDFIRTLPLN